MFDVEPYQRRIMGRVADEIERYRSGQESLDQVLANAWGLFTAADLRDSSEREEFLRLFYALDTEDDLRQPWMPAGFASDDRLGAALIELEAWAGALRDQSDSAV
jgi:hypothetical protein